jgi:hypothetical protein
MNRSAALICVLMLPCAVPAFATGKDPKPSEKPTVVNVDNSSKSTSGAAAVSGSKSTSNASSKSSSTSGAKATGGKATSTSRGGKSDASIVDESSFVDASVYEAEKQAAATAASLEGGFCGAGGMSVQTRGFGVSLSDRSYVCARIAMANVHLELAAAHFESAEALRAATSKGPVGGGALAQDAVIRGRAEVALAEVELAKATRRLDEDDTAVRRFFVKTLGSLPILHFLAPR